MVRSSLEYDFNRSARSWSNEFIIVFRKSSFDIQIILIDLNLCLTQQLSQFVALIWLTNYLWCLKYNKGKGAKNTNFLAEPRGPGVGPPILHNVYAKSKAHYNSKEGKIV